jgi:aldose 1-epimerase
MSRFVVFDVRQIDQASVEMAYVFKDGEENYPGTVPLRVIYRLTDANEFCIDYDAVAADKTTVATHHTHIFQPCWAQQG